MGALVIKNLPEALHARLRQQAQRNRRSVTQEAISLIEAGVVVRRTAPALAPPIKLKGKPITEGELEAWNEEGRE